MNKYKVGELAKKLNVSVRTIRYYEEIGLIKPCVIEENNYHYFDDDCYFKLQKIMFLKSLGLELNEIKLVTATDSFTSLNDAIYYQMLSIDRKIEKLNQIKQSLSDIHESINEKKDINWEELLRELDMSNLNNDIVEQYKNSTNIDIRIKLHKLYSTNNVSWFKWLFSFYNLNDNSKVLEVGCGNGSLWLENKKEVKGDIILSDISKGMIEDAKARLGRKYKYNVFDVCSIPYEDNSFDIVIANHLMFYIKDINKALKEIKRVLKDDGTLYVTTYSENHMKEIRNLVNEFNPKIKLSNVELYDIFGLENGEEILSKHFNNIDIEKYNDTLDVKDSNDLLNYILSCHGNQNEYLENHIDEFASLIKSKFKYDSYKITKEAGLFICKK